MLRNVMVPEMMSLYSMETATGLDPSMTMNVRGIETLSVSPVGSPVEGSNTVAETLTLSRELLSADSQPVAALVEDVGISVLSTAIPRYPWSLCIRVVFCAGLRTESDTISGWNRSVGLPKSPSS